MSEDDEPLLALSFPGSWSSASVVQGIGRFGGRAMLVGTCCPLAMALGGFEGSAFEDATFGSSAFKAEYS